MEECEGDNRDDVGVRCSNPADEYPVRLRSFKGSTSLQGIVEIHANDRWGSICTPPSKWTDDNSRVVCRNLGLGPPVDRPVLPQDGGEDWPVPYSYSSPLLKEIDCVGTESQLALCSHSLWMQHNSTGYGCKRREIVTISCEEPATKDYTIRLYNASSSYNGHLEIFFENEWGVICSNGEWDWKDAKVACHQLGLGTPGRVYTTELTRRMSRPVVARMRCTGEETTLNQCRHSGFGRRTCNDKAIAALTCTKPPEATTGQRPIPIRLVGGIDEREGRLEILYNSTWGRVCDTDWGIEEGNVVCQQLGYGPAEEVPSGEGLYSESESDKAPRIWLDQVECLGHEAMVATCSHSRWGETFCGANQEAGVRCTGTASSLSICWTLILTLCVTARMILNITT